MRECGNCGAANPDDAEFCSACGYVITEAGESLPYWQPRPVVTINNNGKAIASLVVSILGLVSCPIVASVIALVLGYQAKREIAGSGGWQTGEQLAKAGIIIAWIGLIIYVLLFVLIVILAITVSRLPSDYWTMATTYAWL